MEPWTKEFLERLVNTRFDNTSGDVSGEVWSGPYGWRMHRDWLFSGARDNLGQASPPPLLDSMKLGANPAVVALDIQKAINAGVPEDYQAGGNPRDNFAADGGGTGPIKPFADKVHETIKNAHETGVLGDGNEIKLLYLVLRAQILRKERDACKAAIETFAKRVEDKFVGAVVTKDDITQFAKNYNLSPQDPIPGGDWY